MKEYLFILFLIFVFGIGKAQTGIGTITPNASAKLDVYATNKGFLPPRVTLTSATDNITIPSPAEGLLVYNNGNNLSLVAGYYYWNGANWATIATSTGSGVAAAGLTKVYDGIANAADINGTGANFTVPTSGAYLFDFSTSATCGNCTVTLNFYVRNGTQVLKSDMQTSYNNNIHAEYNGKIEVNLVAGTTYNVLVTASSGGVYSNDYCRVYMKQVSGNLPVNQYTIGDVKTGMQSADHNGWIKLDGRLKSTLSASQQTQANLLGIGTNLPDATNAVLMQSSGTLGTVTGSMSTTLAQNQLPNITPSITINSTVATMQNTGSHQHPVAVVASSVGGYAAGNPSAFKNAMAPTTEADADITDRSGTASYITTGIIGSAGDHNHTINTHTHTATSTSINGGVTQQTIDKTPRSLVVNTFIYLGL
nr:hypothetical protein [uncultured Flavobacterium sp.]